MQVRFFTPFTASCAVDLDAMRRAAERDCTDPVLWASLAEKYRVQGRLSMADLCQRRADHYATGLDGRNE